MYKCISLLLVAGWLSPLFCNAQTQDEASIKAQLRKDIAALTDTAMHGRGYVKGGKDSASAYLQRRFAEIGLKTVARKKTYTQPYSFSVNTFPGKMELIINGTSLTAGKDFIIDAGSPTYMRDNLALKTVDMAKIPNNEAWEKMLENSFKDRNAVYYLKNFDQGQKILDIRKYALAGQLPRGCYIIPEKEKLTWDVAQDNNDAVVFYVKESAMTADSGSVSIHDQAQLLSDVQSENIVGYVPGTFADSFVAITAHYDHLGMMGDSAMFPGASDNASGTAMMLYLAGYFAAHPQRYSILFIAFSGEEPGLMGSKYYVKNPIVMLKRMKFLTNIDIMGDATDGVTVVNATEYPDQFALLQKVNNDNRYIPQVKSRGKAANSDHYFFSEAGVPSFFIYSNGGKGYYHDVFDKGNELSLEHVDGVAHMVIDFIEQLR